MNITLDKQIKKYRKEKNKTQEDLANHLGITVQAVSKWERGEGYPDITLLPSISSFFDERMERESAALIQYNDLIKGMQSITKSKDEYPESYGGAYIDDSGDLVVCITESSDRASATEMVKTLTKNPDIETKVVKYSLNHLYQTQDKISDAMIEVSEQTRTKSLQKHSYYELIKDISRVYTDEKDNILVVGILYLNDEKIDLFKKAFPNIDCAVFEEGPINSTTASQWRPGRKFYTLTSWASTGYPVYFTDLDGETQRGFIAAGHSFVSSINAYSSPTGSSADLLATRIDYQFSGSVDAALMDMISDEYEISNTTHYMLNVLDESEYLLPVVGLTVQKEGARTGVSTGVVESTNASVPYTSYNVTLNNLIQTSALNLGGDSGGIMYALSGGTQKIIGSMSGHGSADGSDGDSVESFVCSYVCAVNRAKDALNFRNVDY